MSRAPLASGPQKAANSGTRTQRSFLQIRPRGTADTAPLSFAQRRFWFLEHWTGGTAVHNMPLITRLTGQLDTRALERGLRHLAMRHEILRTRIIVDGDEPVQKIEPAPVCPVQVIDLSGDANPEARASEWLESEVRRPFDLTKLPLLRASVLTIASDEQILALVAHHIIMDAWSIGLLRKELTALYEAECTGSAVDLPPLPVQYADFAIWQHAWTKSPAHDRQLDHWTRQLANVRPLSLPADRARPPVQTFRGAAVPFELNADTSARLKQVCLRQGITPAIALLTALYVLLARHSGQDDIAIGMPGANRNRTEIEGLIGLFLNTHVLRVSLRGNPTFRELLGRVRGVCLDAFSNNELPFDRIVEALQPGRDLSRPPLVQVMFVFQADTGLGVGRMTARPLLVRRTVSRLDMTWQFAEHGGCIRGFLEFSTDLFDEWRMTAMVRQYVRVLEAALTDGERRASDIALLSDSERRNILEDWSGMATGRHDDTVVSSLFEHWAAGTPDAVAVIADEEPCTYAVLNERANHLAHELIARGLGAEDLVAIAVPRTCRSAHGYAGGVESRRGVSPPRSRLSGCPPVVADRTRAAKLCVDAQ